MTGKEISLSIFYGLVIGLSLYTGITSGFTDSHTPPLPFIIEFFCLPIGLVLFSLEYFNKKSINTFKKHLVHLVGLLINGIMMIYIVSLCFI